jgi:hypothetical protein
LNFPLRAGCASGYFSELSAIDPARRVKPALVIVPAGDQESKASASARSAKAEALGSQQVASAGTMIKAVKPAAARTSLLSAAPTTATSSPIVAQAPYRRY